MIDLEETKKKLQARLHGLTERAEEIDEDLGEASDDDSQEQASESAGDEVLEGVGRVTIQEISQIRTALSRLEEGDYGLCSSCGATIAEKRLLALPHATRCVKCS